MRRRTAKAIAAGLALTPIADAAAAASRKFANDAYRFEVELPEACREIPGPSRVTFECTPDPAEVAAADRAKTFSLTVYVEPTPPGGSWLRLADVVPETEKAIARHGICAGSDPTAARVNANFEGSGDFKGSVWSLITGVIVCRGRALFPWQAAPAMQFQHIGNKKFRYWLVVSTPPEIRDAANTAAFQTFFLSFIPFKD